MAKKDVEIIERNKKLVEKYPFLLMKTDPWSLEELSEDKIRYDYTWWDDIPEGWAKAFGEQMCDELLEILKEADYVNEYRIIQIKEKYAEIRWYDCGVPKSVWDKYEAWLRKYEDLSYNTCIVCGEAATYHTTGWILPLCSECFNSL